MYSVFRNKIVPELPGGTEKEGDGEGKKERVRLEERPVVFSGRIVPRSETLIPHKGKLLSHATEIIPCKTDRNYCLRTVSLDFTGIPTSAQENRRTLWISLALAKKEKRNKVIRKIRGDCV